MYFPDAYTHKRKCIYIYKSVLYEGGVIVLFFRSVLLSMHNAIPPLSCFALHVLHESNYRNMRFIESPR